MGYFWISYYDKHCCQHPEMGAVSFQDVDLFEYDTVYYHDYHGWRDTKTDCKKVFNAFTVQENSLLQAVSFYTAKNNVEYELVVYDRFENGDLSIPIITETGTIDFMGLHTIDLAYPIGFEQGDDFYLYLYLSDGGQAFDRTSIVPVLLTIKPTLNTVVESSAKAGQSYYFSDSKWKDLFFTPLGDPTWFGTANFCVKGLSSDWVPTNPQLDAYDEINLRGAKAGSKIDTDIYIENVGEEQSSLFWQITDYPDWGTWSFSSLSGDYLKPESGAEKISVSIRLPMQRNTELTGEITIINREDANNEISIPVYIKTSKPLSKTFTPINSIIAKILSLDTPLFNRILEQIKTI